VGDYDALADLDVLADELRSSIDELAAAAGTPSPEPNAATAPAVDSSRRARAAR
jgi:hypothetical protein